MRTFMAKASEIERKWYIIDAEGKPLGRVAAQAAAILRGKHLPTFTPHADCGDPGGLYQRLRGGQRI